MIEPGEFHRLEARLGCPNVRAEPRVRTRAELSETVRLFELVRRILGGLSDRSRAKAILSETELGCPIVKCPNADP